MKNKMLIVWSLVLAVLLIGCSGESTEGSNTSDSSPQLSSTEATGSTETIEFWHSMGGRNGELVDEMVERFNESHENIEVVATFQGGYDELVTKLQQAVASNTAPEVAMVERAYVQMFADSEVLEDLTPYFDESGEDINDFSEGLMGHSYFNDQLVSLPLNRSTPIMHINKTMLDEEGLSIPQDWEELKEVANALVEEESGEITRYGLTMPYDTWYPIAMITQAEGKFFNDEGTSVDFVDNGVGNKVFSFLKEMQETGALYYPPAQDSGNITSQLFNSGKVGLYFTSTGSIGGLAESVDFEYVTAFLPKDEVFATPTGGANVVMMEGTENKAAAWEFIRWMELDPEGALPFVLESGYLPFTESMTQSTEIQELWENEPNRKVAYEQLDYAIDTNKDVSWPEIMHEFFSQ
ncbi:ABC transporter substrate-binding protein [Bacillus sp. JCM 19034]|uniref:ABC transporter substrate-binding protein n=1 Tax=Bacillus sp. JCM 19034 TaxID=1481928 RepID=UPI000B33D4D5|nr:ABC transporter substrate-binding protein [Bacillus sp. JCM 19034]